MTDLKDNITAACGEQLNTCFGVSADISHAPSNTSITRLSKGFERMIADYQDYRGGYQEELYNVKDHFPQSLKGKDISITRTSGPY